MPTATGRSRGSWLGEGPDEVDASLPEGTQHHTCYTRRARQSAIGRASGGAEAEAVTPPIIQGSDHPLQHRRQRRPPTLSASSRRHARRRSAARRLACKRTSQR
jgi:hypothetical protein